ncbi:MAG TPA: tRNA (adenosine(37)-N6)-threonylcarbamoyltransferase complex dimerization subunit type 1 TsaB [Synergistales bacterium]|jgi:tRNA threonylcarbamoyladenosine biosynthesis protein TsaB|nr:tRNA (adenosine(37)-N6)-threonylcarbamoyltransferase complex dimerization subunit type 1 TsaB [Synergistales bacterium]HRV70512.1 tRNA (adenosine(37)-N6)-threonylcarbamoyltransferase complex dimerization subunit type 1 TsaB [Thermovirgaceae bacterium]
MIVLGIDCSTKGTNVGVARNGTIISEYNVSIGRRQSADLPWLVEKALSDAGIDLRELDLIASSSGPGYFTGIRVGISYAAALAEGLEKKIVLPDSLHCLAAPFLDGNRRVMSVIRSRKGFFYYSVLEGQYSERRLITPPSLESTAELMNICGIFNPSVLVLDGDPVFREEMKIPDSVYAEWVSVRGGWVALIGESLSKNAIPPSEARGYYIREPDIGQRKFHE